MLEQDLLHKWGNGNRSNQAIGLADVYRFCQDIISVRGDGGFVELETPKGSEFSYYLLVFDEIETQNRKAIWIQGAVRKEESVEQVEPESDGDPIISSFLIEKLSRRGRDRFCIYTSFEPFYSPMTKSIIGEETIFEVDLNREEITTLFRGIRSALFRTVIEEIPDKKNSL